MRYIHSSGPRRRVNARGRGDEGSHVAVHAQEQGREVRLAAAVGPAGAAHADGLRARRRRVDRLRIEEEPARRKPQTLWSCFSPPCAVQSVSNKVGAKTLRLFS